MHLVVTHEGVADEFIRKDFDRLRECLKRGVGAVCLRQFADPGMKAVHALLVRDMLAVQVLDQPAARSRCCRFPPSSGTDASLP